MRWSLLGWLRANVCNRRSRPGRFPARQARVVGGLANRIRQADLRRIELVEQPPPLTQMPARSDLADLGHPHVGRVGNHFRVALEKLDTQQTVVVRRPGRVPNIQPFQVRIERIFHSGLRWLAGNDCRSGLRLYYSRRPQPPQENSCPLRVLGNTSFQTTFHRDKPGGVSIGAPNSGCQGSSFYLKLQVREPENGDWLRRSPVLQCVFTLSTVPVPFFGRRHRGTWKRGAGTEPSAFFRGFDANWGSEPVPLFHSPLTV